MKTITEILEKAKEKKRVQKYYSKGWIMGNIIRIREYEKPVFYGFHSNGGRKVTDEKVTSKENREIALSRMSDNLVCLVNENFNMGSKFITLTFKENLMDLTVANYEFEKFIMRLGYKIKNKNFKYLAVIEFQRRGAIHYHMISDLNYIPNKILRSIWSGGFVRINRIKNVDNVGAYLVKYMCKADDTRLHKRKSYLRSENLGRPKELIGEKLREVVEKNNLKSKKPVKNEIYDTEYYGWTIEREYYLQQTTRGRKVRKEIFIKKCERIGNA